MKKPELLKYAPTPCPLGQDWIKYQPPAGWRVAFARRMAFGFSIMLIKEN